MEGKARPCRWKEKPGHADGADVLLATSAPVHNASALGTALKTEGERQRVKIERGGLGRDIGRERPR